MKNRDLDPIRFVSASDVIVDDDTMNHDPSNVDQMDKNLEFLKWDRDSNNKVYYGFFILFLGGFALSINSSIKLEYPTNFDIFLVYALRVSAIIGVIINFLMQNLAQCQAQLAIDLIGNKCQMDSVKLLESTIDTKIDKNKVDMKLKKNASVRASVRSEMICEEIEESCIKNEKLNELLRASVKNQKKIILEKDRRLTIIIKVMEYLLWSCAMIFLFSALKITWTIVPRAH